MLLHGAKAAVVQEVDDVGARGVLLIFDARQDIRAFAPWLCYPLGRATGADHVREEDIVEFFVVEWSAAERS